jgi:catalase
MNKYLDNISNSYEGIINNREGHNFPSTYIPNDKNHFLYEYKNKCKYVIGIYNNKCIKHELLHAKYYIDKNYFEQINILWNNLSENNKKHITCFLINLGYNKDKIIDEFQAYFFTEKKNFFGITI